MTLASCGKQQKTVSDTASAETTSKTQYLDVDVATFQQMMASKPGIVLDVRTPGEFAQGKIAQAINIDITRPSFASKAQKLDVKRPIYVYCHVGSRSSFAMKQMQNLGFTRIYNLKGGLSAWRQAGLQVE
ncbi:hypothetical protein BKI52_33985 [marine bacterium AO1-C]|nr:hypothetical protein BKI52_33985 [marine bacterium AO1-C]